MSFDRRTGKPIAVSVVKIAVGSATFEMVNEKRVTGTIVVEAKQMKLKPGSVSFITFFSGVKLNNNTAIVTRLSHFLNPVTYF